MRNITNLVARQAILRILFLMITISIALLGHFSSWLDPSARASTDIFVNSTADTVGNDGQCTLREAITAANNDGASGALAGECAAGSGADIIKFAISGSGVQTIIPLTSLPSIINPVTIDGYTQPGASPNTQANGDNAVLLIEINGNGLAANGLNVGGSGSGSTIRGLVINRFNGNGISLSSSNGNLIEGNYIGIDPAGSTIRANQSNGISLSTSSDNTIGGTSPASRNIITGNATSGVVMGGFGFATSSNNSVLGNYIGTDKTGTVALGNTQDGIGIGDGAPGNIVGGTAPGAGNLISGNSQYGIDIQFNLNAHFPPNNNLVQGNFIGTDVTGTLPRGNGVDGILLGKLSDFQTIGGTAAGAGNRVAFNGGRGVSTSLSTGDSILGNAIFSNGSLGIDLASNGVTPNDACDADTGDNTLQNFPVLSFSGGILSGTLDSTANTTFTIEFFSNPSPDSSGFGEGQTFLRRLTVGTDAMCNASFNDVRFSPSVPAGQWITATATDPNGNTSEFSQAVLLASPTAANGSVSGHIVDNDGNPVEGATVRMTGTESRLTITDSNGNYGFLDVETNGFYTVTPSRVNYSFSPANRSFSLLGVHTEASFTASANGDHANAIDTTEFFVRQQYLDFLGREPDAPGFIGWVNTINNCAPGDTSCDRVHVSEMFFRSAEFQERGYFVYRFYSSAFGRKPDYAEFTPDLARVSGFLTNDQLAAARTAFTNDFMARPAFAAQYGSLSNAAYVDALTNTAAVNLANRQTLIDRLNAGTLTRARVLRQIAESGEVYQKYYNQAFVVMEYFGYLRRDPDALYLNWIQVLDANPADSRHMVNGFVNSTEYRNRFAQ